MIADYREIIREVFPKKTDLQIEHMCVVDPELQKLTGGTEHEHRLAAMGLLHPKRVNHEWRQRAVQSYYTARRRRKKELSWLGSTNSNKTGTAADLALEIFWEAPESTSVYLTSPYEDATETGIWARTQEQFNSATALHPHLPGRIVESENAIMMYKRNPLSFIKVVTVDKIGKMVGKKPTEFSAGMMLIIVDEAPEFKQGGAPLLKVLSNLRGVPNMLILFAGNFADVNDLLGQAAEPALEGGYEVLNVDTDQEWDTSRGGMAIRFDGHQSPNVKAGRDIYPFVTTIEYLEDLATLEHGKDTPGYYRFGRSFPMLDFNEFTVTNAVKIKAGGCYGKAEWSSDAQTVGAHCDPGFGGDPCMFLTWRFGRAMLEGQWTDVFDIEDITVIPVHVGKKDEVGEEITVDNQIAMGCKVELDKRKIPYRHFSFDDSMRGGIVQAMMRVIGVMVVAISSAGVATTRKLSAVKQTIDPSVKPEKKKVKTARDAFANFLTEMHFALSSAIDSGQLRGLQSNKDVVRQLCTRRWRWAGKKREIEPKVSHEEGAKARGWGYKLRSGGKSPNESDALVGGMEMARRLGFALTGLSTKTGGAIELIKEMHRNLEVARLMDSLKGNPLPSGRLHSMESDREKSRARLNS